MTSPTKIKKYKIGYRLGAGVFEKTQGQKFIAAQARRAKSAGRGRRSRTTDYGLSLIDKQRIRYAYGLRERQFRNYVKKTLASHDKSTTPADRLHQMLETRLDNVVYRLGYAHTRAFARQLVSHGHFLVNGTRTTVPSYQLKIGDEISIREGSKSRPVFQELSKKLKNAHVPSWLTIDSKTFVGKVTGTPTDPDSFFNFQGVIEFYSKS